MNELESGKDKIKKICDILQNETLTPAKKEAEKLIQEAEKKARIIVKEAEEKAQEVLRLGNEKLTSEKALLEKQIKGALSQAKELLRQDIQERLFNEGMSNLVAKGEDPTLMANLITALVKAVEKEGLSADFSAEIGKSLSVEKVNATIAKAVLDKLEKKSVTVGDFIGGAQLKLHDQNLTLDLSDRALKELLGPLLRGSFRDLLFKETEDG